MDSSVFMDKSMVPNHDELLVHLKETFDLWNTIAKYIYNKYPTATEEWNFPGKKYGWSFRIKDKKRAIAYFLPREGFFMVAFVFGQKATNQVLDSDISHEIKTELQNARVYAEGRGIRIEISDESKIKDIKKLIEIKLAN